MIRLVHRVAAALGVVALLTTLTANPAQADEVRDKQWYLKPMRLVEAQRLSDSGAGVIVAVLDSGVDGTHKDLIGATVSGRILAGDKPDRNVDTDGHGTGMASIIAGRGHGSGSGVLGVAPKAKVMPLQPVSDPQLVATGIRYAVAHGATVINMSFSLDSAGSSLREAVAEAVAADVVLVAGVGNGGTAATLPATLPGVLGVGSVDRENQVASFSNKGKDVDLVAFGVDIPTAEPGDKYSVSRGTSDSAALVSGAAALVRARYPDMSAAEVVDRLTSTATDRGPKGRDDRYGAGQLNLIAALTAPRTPPSAAASASSPTTTGPAVVAEKAAENSRNSGFPPWLFVAVGVLLLIVGVAGYSVARARRNS